MMRALHPIGVIHSCFGEKFATPRQPGLSPHAQALITIHKEFQPEISLLGLESFSHIWVLFAFHQNADKKFRAKINPPRLNGESIGVFATRSPHRPNPIGLSAVRLLEIKGDQLYVAGVDMVDGTPVLDIKPYIPLYDSLPEAGNGWLERVDDVKIQVRFSAAALEDLRALNVRRLTPPLPVEEFKALIIEVLTRDPRPRIYKDPGFRATRPKDAYATRICGVDVRFAFVDDTSVEVERLQ